MKKAILRITEYGHYLKKIIESAEHHAPKVATTVLVLGSLIAMRKDVDSPIQVLVKEGSTKRVAWVKFKGVTYAFSYNHDNECVEIRKDSLRGIPVLKLNDEHDIIVEFENYFGKG